MVLGAMAKYSDLNIAIIPVGLNYYQGHRFRSMAYVDYGDPIYIDSKIVEQFKLGGDAKRKACEYVLNMVNDALKSVTVTAPDWETLQVRSVLYQCSILVRRGFICYLIGISRREKAV